MSQNTDDSKSTTDADGDGSLHALVALRTRPHRVTEGPSGVETHRSLPNLPDKVAVEAALRYADHVTAVSAGGEEAENVVRDALRMGCDDGIHVTYDPVDRALNEAFATVVARVGAREGVDLVLLGDSAPVMGREVVGHIGETLDWPAVSGVTTVGEDVETSVSPADGELLVQRKSGPGEQEILTVPTPAVFGMDAGFANPRTGSLEAVINGQQAELNRQSLTEVAPHLNRFSMSVGKSRIHAMQVNERWGRGDPPRSGTVESRIRQMVGRADGVDEKTNEIVDEPPAEAADRVVEFLHERDLL